MQWDEEKGFVRYLVIILNCLAYRQLQLPTDKSSSLFAKSNGQFVSLLDGSVQVGFKTGFETGFNRRRRFPACSGPWESSVAPRPAAGGRGGGGLRPSTASP